LLTVIEEAVAPVFHVPPAFPFSVTELPAQKVVLPFAEIFEAIWQRINRYINLI
jgi:hypothetical protein